MFCTYNPRKVAKHVVRRGASLGVVLGGFAVFGLFAIGMLKYGIWGLLFDIAIGWIIYDAL